MWKACGREGPSCWVPWLLGNSLSPYPGLWHPGQHWCHLELCGCQAGQGGTPSPIIWEGWVGCKATPPSFCQGGAPVPGCPPHLGHPSHLCAPEGPAPRRPWDRPIPTQPGMPPLAKTCGHGCVVVGGCGGAREEPGEVCLPGRGKNLGAPPHSPLFPATPPGSPHCLAC